MTTQGKDGDNPTDDATEATKVGRTLQLLDSEIEHIRSAETQHGWTSWGLVGGIVGSLWLLSDELKTGNVGLELTALAIVLFSTLVDSVRWLTYQLWLWKNPKNEPVRFRWSNEFFSGSELVFALEILRPIGLLIVAFLFAPQWSVALTTLTIAYVWFVILAILWLVLTQAEFPIRQGFTKKGLVFILAFVLPCLASFFLYLTLAPSPTGDVIASYRTGGLVVAVSYLILSLAIVTKDSPILQSLIATRRSIVFNHVGINSAARQAEIALKGMEVPEAIQKDLPPILALVEKLNTDTSRLMSHIQTMQKHLPESGDSEVTVSAKIRILSAHRNAGHAILREREDTLSELTLKFQQLMRRRQRIQGVMPEAADFFNQLDTGMKTILDESDLRFNSYVEEANKYDEQLAATAGAEEKPMKDTGNTASNEPNEPLNIPQQMVKVFEASKQLTAGEITPVQFQQELMTLRELYLKSVDTPKPINPDLLWKQYELETNLFKHYLEFVLKFNAFYYLVTGAILSFYFSKSDVPLVRYALLFPVLMSIIFGVLFAVGVFLNKVTRDDIFRIRDELRLEVAPDANVLSAVLALSALLMFVVAGVLLWFFFPNLIPVAVGFIIVILILLWLLFR